MIPAMDVVITEDPTFTGNSFTTAANGEIIPEYCSAKYLRPLEGAELLEIRKDGTETLRAIYSKSAERFLPAIGKKGVNAIVYR